MSALGKHGPCPMCGSSDRYRFDDKGGSGSYLQPMWGRVWC